MLSRRRFLALGGAAALGTLLVGPVACGRPRTAPAGSAPPTRRYRSRPDLQPPTVIIDHPAQSVSPGYVVVAAGGALLLDNRGEPVWFNPASGLTNVRVQEYAGRPVLTWWMGTINRSGYGVGTNHIVDSAYRPVATVAAGSGLAADLHEFLLTPEGTALITAYRTVPADLRAVGGPAQGFVLESVVQEIDVRTGAVVFDWRSLDHVGIEESFATLLPQVPTMSPGPSANLPSAPSASPMASPGSEGAPYDYFHVNSVDLDSDGNLLVSARNTWAVYKVDRSTGSVLWRLNGKHSDFRMTGASDFEWQHDVRRQPDGTISVFDNASYPDEEPLSRPMVLAVDETHRTASLLRQYTHPGLRASSQGNIQLLPNGNAFVGWGALPNFTEFSSGGEILFDAHFAPAVQSYRALRSPWVGRPSDLPALAVERSSSGLVVHASWNGATEVSAWTVLGGASTTALTPLATAPRAGFETAITLRSRPALVAVVAVDGSGTALSQSAAVASA